MNGHLQHRNEDQTKQRILELLQQLPDEIVEKILEDMLWMLDDMWRQDGISQDVQQHLDALLYQPIVQDNNAS